MPSLSPQLQVGIFNDLYNSLNHVTIRPKDPELEVLTARFFLSLNDEPPLQKEVFQIGRDQYNNEADINKDAKSAIKVVRAYLEDARIQQELTEQSRQSINTLINNLKTVGHNSGGHASNSTESLKSWKRFTDQICAAPTSVEITLAALKTNIDSHAHLILSNKLKKQTEDLDAELKQQEGDRKKLRNREDEEKKAAISKIIPTGHVKGLIDKFTPKTPKPATTPLKNDRKKKKNDTEKKERKRLDNEAKERKRFEDEEKEKKRLEKEAKERKRLEDEARERKRLEDEARERQRLEDEARERQRLADAERARLAGSKASSPPTMKQQQMSQAAVSVPVITVTNTHQIDEVLSAAKALSGKQEIKESNKLFSDFHQQAILASDPVTRSLELRSVMLKDWNENLLPLQSQLLDRIAQLQVLQDALSNAKEFINASSDLTHSVKTEYLKELDKRILSTSHALDSYESTLEELNKMEVGLANTNITVYHDPDYEGQTNVAATVVRKILASEDRDALLANMRQSLGSKISERSSGNILNLSTQTFEYERDKIDTTRDYTLLGFAGTDNKSLNSPKGDVTAVRLETNLSTVYSMSAAENNRNNFTLQVIDLREDLDPTHLMVKFVTNVHHKLGDLLPLFDNASPEDLYKLFSQLPKQIPDIKTLENFLAANMQPNLQASPAKVAKAMHKELIRILRNEKNPDVPSDIALRFAKDAVTKVIENTDGQQTICLHGKNAEIRRSIKYYCEMMIQQFKGFPEEQRKYDYFDAQNKFRPVLKGGLFGSVSSLFSYKDPAEKALLKGLGLNKAGRRVSKELLRNDSEFDEQVRAKTTLAEELEMQKSKSESLSALTNALQTSNTAANDSAFLQNAFTAAKSNARSAHRLPEATTALQIRQP
ncbi:MAG: hypothetical protein V4501_12690 [Pseudomonadota bacterium]